MEDYKYKKNEEPDLEQPITLRTILQNAVILQALYAGKKIKLVESSALVH